MLVGRATLGMAARLRDDIRMLQLGPCCLCFFVKMHGHGEAAPEGRIADHGHSECVELDLGCFECL